MLATYNPESCLMNKVYNYPLFLHQKKEKCGLLLKKGYLIMPLTCFWLNRVKLQGEISHLKLMNREIQKGHASARIKLGHVFVSSVESAAKRPFLLVIILLR